MLSSPFLQGLVIATFGFDDFTGVRVLVELSLAWCPSTGLGLGNWCTSIRLRIKQVDHVFQAVAVFTQQCTQLGLKFNFFLQASINAITRLISWIKSSSSIKVPS
ncbi:hypothetical protein D3C84_1123320 [compost metagenome]